MKYDQDVVDACIAVLRKNEISVIIGYKVDGNLTALKRNTAVYDSELNGIHRLKDGTRFDIPKGKFRFEYRLNGEDE